MRIFINILDKTHLYNVDESITVVDLKRIIEDNEFIPINIQTLKTTTKILHHGYICDYGIQDSQTIFMTFPILGGTRYKKSSSQMRWKWKNKRMKRLKRKRRKMRNRAK